MAAGLVAFAGAMASFPLLYKKHGIGRNLSTTPEALPGQAVVRGAYNNSGSKDIGADPDWDPRTGTWRGRTSVRQRGAELRGEASAPRSEAGAAPGA